MMLTFRSQSACGTVDQRQPMVERDFQLSLMPFSVANFRVADHTAGVNQRHMRARLRAILLPQLGSRLNCVSHLGTTIYPFVVPLRMRLIICFSGDSLEAPIGVSTMKGPTG